MGPEEEEEDKEEEPPTLSVNEGYIFSIQKARISQQ